MGPLMVWALHRVPTEACKKGKRPVVGVDGRSDPYHATASRSTHTPMEWKLLGARTTTMRRLWVVHGIVGDRVYGSTVSAVIDHTCNDLSLHFQC